MENLTSLCSKIVSCLVISLLITRLYQLEAVGQYGDLESLVSHAIHHNQSRKKKKKKGILLFYKNKSVQD